MRNRLPILPIRYGILGAITAIQLLVLANVSFSSCPGGFGPDFASMLEGTPQNSGFYLIQLLNDGGGNYTVHVYDATNDPDAHASIVVTDCQLGTTIVDESFDSTIGAFGSPASVDVPVIINATSFHVQMTAGEFSYSRICFGDSTFTYLGPGNGGNAEDTMYWNFEADPPVPAEPTTWGRIKSLFR